MLVFVLMLTKWRALRGEIQWMYEVFSSWLHNATQPAPE